MNKKMNKRKDSYFHLFIFNFLYLSDGTYHVKIIITLYVNNYFNMDVS